MIRLDLKFFRLKIMSSVGQFLLEDRFPLEQMAVL